MKLHWDKQINASYQVLARQSPNKAFYWCYAQGRTHNFLKGGGRFFSMYSGQWGAKN